MDNLAHSLNNTSSSTANVQNATQSSTKRLQRETDAQKFKYKSNAKQFLHNAEIEDLAKEIVEQLERGDPNIHKALGVAKNVVTLIQKRQKLSKLTDRSEAGWLAIEEYESDELADNSEDREAN